MNRTLLSIFKLVSVMAVIMAVAFACSSPEQGNEAAEPGNSNSSAETNTPAPPEVKPPDPVTLKIYDALMTDEDYPKLVANPLKAKYPHITLERSKMTSAAEVVDLRNMIAANQAPDVMLLPIFYQQQMYELGLDHDLTALMKKHNFDASKIDPALMATIPVNSNKNVVDALPLYKNIMATFYNKDLYNRFAIAPPKDGMTWDEAIDLGRKLTRTEDGVQYYGLFAPFDSGQLSLNVLDKATNKATLASNPRFVLPFQMQKDMYAAQNMKHGLNSTKAFFEEKRLATLVHWMANALRDFAKNEVNWDMVTLPVYKDLPNVHSKADFHAAFISKVTKHPDAAFNVISYLSSDPEVQTLISKSGKIPTLNDSAIIKQFGSEVMTGKNLAVLEKTKMAVLPPQHHLENVFNTVGKHRNAALQKIINNGVDINTALAEAAEIINKEVETQMK